MTRKKPARKTVGIKRDKVVKPFCSVKGCKEHVYFSGEECMAHYAEQFNALRLTK